LHVAIAASCCQRHLHAVCKLALVASIDWQQVQSGDVLHLIFTARCSCQCFGRVMQTKNVRHLGNKRLESPNECQTYWSDRCKCQRLTVNNTSNCTHLHLENIRSYLYRSYYNSIFSTEYPRKFKERHNFIWNKFVL